MTSIPSLASKTIALSLLSDIRGKNAGGTEAQEETLGKPAGPWATATGLSPVLSPKVRAELMKAAQTEGSAAPSTNLTHTGDPVFERVAALQFSIETTDLSADELRRLGGLGDSYVRRDTPQLQQPEFEEFIRYYYQNKSPSDNPSEKEFLDSISNGDITIRRAIDVPELGWKTTGYNIYSDGNHIGDTMRSTLNKEALNDMRASGLKAYVGSIYGQDFLITWPDPAAKTA